MTVPITLDPGAYIPTKAYDNDAGFDLRTLYRTGGRKLHHGYGSAHGSSRWILRPGGR